MCYVMYIIFVYLRWSIPGLLSGTGVGGGGGRCQLGRSSALVCVQVAVRDLGSRHICRLQNDGPVKKWTRGYQHYPYGFTYMMGSNPHHNPAKVSLKLHHNPAKVSLRPYHNPAKVWLDLHHNPAKVSPTFDTDYVDFYRTQCRCRTAAQPTSKSLKAAQDRSVAFYEEGLCPVVIEIGIIYLCLY